MLHCVGSFYINGHAARAHGQPYPVQSSRQSSVSLLMQTRRFLPSTIIVAALWLVATAAAAQTLRVAAASDLQAALPGIAARFEKDSGAKVTLTFGSSGNFFTQIQNGAPFDVFLSADIDYPRRL